jgi:N-acetylmuramoyl-L-alanine amidase
LATAESKAKSGSKPEANVVANAQLDASKPSAKPILAATTKPALDPIAELAKQVMTAGPVAVEPTSKPQPDVPEATTQPPAPVLPKTPMQKGMRPLIVAIDAGHGGQDPGAHGLNGAREKDVTLAIARELARQVNATPGLKAYLTRDADVFIPLEYRARRASANKADIFLSIHADAAENRGARGSSVYVLSTRGASSQRARWLADKENAADVIGGGRVKVADNTLTSVLLDLTQSGNMKASEDAADHVLGGLKRVGNNHKPDIERANFAVLRTSDKMPAMLVETAFISNPDEEKRLTDPTFQHTLAGAILDGIDTYFSRQPPPGTLYAARAQAAQSAQSETPVRGGIGGSR